MIAGSRKHGRHLRRLWQQACADAETCRALLALTGADRTWLIERGWVEPPYAQFVRLNGEQVLTSRPVFR